MLISIAIQSISTITNPPNILWLPKKTKDHTTFIPNCTANTRMAICTSFLPKPFLQTKNRDVPINIYNVLHIGPTAQFGGVQPGLVRYTYQVVISLSV